MLRFGISYQKIISRVMLHEGPRIFFISIGKSGTHLLERALCLHPSLYRRWIPTLTTHNFHKYTSDMDVLLASVKPNQILVAHWYYDPVLLASLRSGKFKMLFMMRDPRDVIISEIHYVLRSAKHLFFKWYAAEPDMKSRIKLAINGTSDRSYLPINERLELHLPWREVLFPVRFEELINMKTQAVQLERVFQYLDVPFDNSLLTQVQSNMISKSSPTFRKGTSGGWMEYFDEELKDLFKRTANDQLIKMGYENDPDW